MTSEEYDPFRDYFGLLKQENQDSHSSYTSSSNRKDAQIGSGLSKSAPLQINLGPKPVLGRGTKTCAEGMLQEQNFYSSPVFHQNGFSSPAFHQNCCSPPAFHQNDCSPPAFHQNDCSPSAFHQNGCSPAAFQNSYSTFNQEQEISSLFSDVVTLQDEKDKDYFTELPHRRHSYSSVTNDSDQDSYSSHSVPKNTPTGSSSNLFITDSHEDQFTRDIYSQVSNYRNRAVGAQVLKTNNINKPFGSPSREFTDSRHVRYRNSRHQGGDSLRRWSGGETEIVFPEEMQSGNLQSTGFFQQIEPCVTNLEELSSVNLQNSSLPMYSHSSPVYGHSPPVYGHMAGNEIVPGDSSQVTMANVKQIYAYLLGMMQAQVGVGNRMESLSSDSRNTRCLEEGRFCAFCKRNRETKEFYTTHVVKDSRGKVICPVLRKYVCPVCQATGDKAHTLRHCPTRFQNLQLEQQISWSQN